MLASLVITVLAAPVHRHSAPLVRTARRPDWLPPQHLVQQVIFAVLVLQLISKFSAPSDIIARWVRRMLFHAVLETCVTLQE